MANWKHLVSAIHYHNTYGHQICQGRNILQGALTNRFEWPLDKVVLWDHVVNKIDYISTCRRSMDTKLG